MENFTSQTNCKKTTRHKAHQIEDLADPEPNPAGDRTGLTEWKCGFAACAECKTLNNRKAKIKRQLPPAKLAQVRFKMAQLTVSSAGTGMEVGMEAGMEAGMGAGSREWAVDLVLDMDLLLAVDLDLAWSNLADVCRPPDRLQRTTHPVGATWRIRDAQPRWFGSCANCRPN